MCNFNSLCPVLRASFDDVAAQFSFVCADEDWPVVVSLLMVLFIQCKLVAGFGCAVDS